MIEVEPEVLRDAVRDRYGCNARFLEAVPVVERFEHELVWEGDVHVFDLIGHPASHRCYAWTHAAENSDRRRFFIFLHQGAIDSPAAAVRASLIEEYRRGQAGH